jgi:uncharacterized protein (TIGR02466 family)
MGAQKIELIFPTSIAFDKLQRQFTNTELEFINKNSNNVYKNAGNTISNDNYILNNPELIDLKKFIVQCANNYMKTIYKPKNNIEVYVTQSWLNYNSNGEFHHIHHHPNSFLSGVLYINANLEKDTIDFYNGNYNQFEIASTSYDVYNAKRWTFSVESGDIIIFPSSLTHGVQEIEHKDTRISLAFNTFLKGTLGNNVSLNELIIN